MDTHTCKNIMLPMAVAAGSLVALSTPASPVLYTDPAVTNTVVFRDYNGSPDSGISYSPGGASSPSQNITGGVSTWTYSGNVSDPKILYNDGGGTWDHASYPWVRARFQQSRTTGGFAQIWEQNAGGGQAIVLGPSGTLVESTGNPTNPAPNGNGLRIDPFTSSQNNDVFTLDYVMLDSSETLGLGEWDKAGDVQGWSTPNNTGITVSNSVLSGTTDGDSQVTQGPGFDANKFKFLEIRMKASGGSAQVFWGTNNGYAGTRSLILGAGDGNFHTYLIDFTGESSWSGANMNVRLDPAGGGGIDFEIDYIRVSTNASVPEPSSLALLGLGGLLVARRRRV